MPEYIDRDIFRQELINTPFYPRCKTTPDLLTSVQDRLNDTLELLDNMPPADVPPIKRGRWIGTWSCSCCGRAFYEWEGKPDWNYCPICGADNRGESDD